MHAKKYANKVRMIPTFFYKKKVQGLDTKFDEGHVDSLHYEYEVSNMVTASYFTTATVEWLCHLRFATLF